MAVYQSTFVSPQNVSIDPSSISEFSAIVQVDSTVDSYRWIVRELDGTIVFDSTKTTLTTPLFNGEELSIEIPINTFSTGETYQHDVETFEGALSATSAPVSFVANSLPTASISVPNSVTSQSFTFTFTYAQSEGIGIEYYIYEITDSEDNIVIETRRFYTGNTNYTFQGFLDGQSYSIRAFGVNKRQIAFETNTENFTVSYAKPNVNITPIVTQNRFNSIINVIWGGIVQITGVITGTQPTYAEDFAYTGDNAINMPETTSVTFTVDIPEDFTEYISWRANADFLSGNGMIGRLEDDLGSFYDIGYSGGQFFFNNNGVTVRGSTRTSIPTDIVEIFIRPNDLVIKTGSNIEIIKVL